MAQALSIVAEAGIHGKKHNGLIEAWVKKGHVHQSKRGRISICSAHQFSGPEFEDYLILAWRSGLLERSKYKEVEWKTSINKSSYEVEDEDIRLTREGWEFVEKYDKTTIELWLETLTDRVPYVFLSVVSAALTTWAIMYWGAP
ncbi:hypothetical protein [Ruegeria halocynthiae]|uniref:hypothetical protein n=1 Tax=Ruegeria halocynthiae TaxID=985054 RepID=UPI00056376DB|nr:hypothetical protein [Ruegeria halocynthiae]